MAAIVRAYRKVPESNLVGSIAALPADPNEGLMKLPGLSSIIGSKGSATLTSQSSFYSRKAVFLQIILSRKRKGGWWNGEQSLCDSMRSIFTFPGAEDTKFCSMFP